MNRAIKFRAYSKKAGVMLAPATLQELLTAAISQKSLNVEADPAMDENIIFLQWTGLLDKNGKEIYEGDVITTCPDDHQIIEEHMVVEWIADTGGFHRHSFVGVGKGLGPGGTNVIHTLPSQECEIIGNVYENPDLLSV